MDRLFGTLASPCAGLATGNNDIFQRIWSEVNFNKIGFDMTSTEDTKIIDISGIHATVADYLENGQQTILM